MTAEDDFQRRYSHVQREQRRLYARADRGAPGDAMPETFIQWKGTNVCLDFHCLCGKHLHFDEEFLYHVKCGHCGQVFALGDRVPAISLAGFPEPDSCVHVGYEDRCHLSAREGGKGLVDRLLEASHKLRGTAGAGGAIDRLLQEAARALAGTRDKTEPPCPKCGIAVGDESFVFGDGGVRWHLACYRSLTVGETVSNLGVVSDALHETLRRPPPYQRLLPPLVAEVERGPLTAPVVTFAEAKDFLANAKHLGVLELKPETVWHFGGETARCGSRGPDTYVTRAANEVSCPECRELLRHTHSADVCEPCSRDQGRPKGCRFNPDNANGAADQGWGDDPQGRPL